MEDSEDNGQGDDKRDSDNDRGESFVRILTPRRHRDH